MELESGKTYKLSFDYRADNVQQAGDANRLMKMLKASDGKDGENKDGYKYQAINWTGVESGVWNHFDDFTFTTTESGMHYIYFRLWYLAGELYLDNINVVEVTA